MRRKTKFTYYQINHQIRASQIRLLGENGKQIGIVERNLALRQAQTEGKDLVLIAPKANPPVVKLIDFKKFKYLEAKKKKREKKKTKKSTIKQVRLSLYMGDHDFKTRLNQINNFLKEGNQVKIFLAFKGRQIVHREIGQEMINRAIEQLNDVCRVVKQPYFERKVLVVILTPKGNPKPKNAQSKN